tara:strand:- start:43 stop:489 length:447 start_codon:yes stop_codon:yes gene_type:complete
MEHSKLLKIAKLQKRIMWLLVIGLITSVLANGASNSLKTATASGADIGTMLTSLGLSLVILLAAFGVYIFQLVTLAQLRNEIGAGVAGTVICCILLCIPLVGLIILALTSQKATNVLKEQGYSVGFMGLGGDAMKDLEMKANSDQILS